MPILRSILPLALFVACTGQPPSEPPASADGLADRADKVAKAEKAIKGAGDVSPEEERAVREALEAERERRRKESVERQARIAPDDGWSAPPSVADPTACQGAPPPQPHDPRSLQPTPLPQGANPALTDLSLADQTAPDVYKVRFETSAGPFVIEVNRDWAPIGADRFYNMVKIGYFDGASFFRNVAGFMVQFGISPYPAVNDVWRNARIKDEPVKIGNRRGIVTFAKCGAPDCRSTQVFINHSHNPQLDGMGFAGFGRVVEGMDVVDKLYSCYGEGAPGGRGPRQDLVQKLGKSYLDAGWPKLDRVERAVLVD